MQLSFNCSCSAGNNILLTFKCHNLIFDFSCWNDMCVNHFLCLTKQRSLYEPSLSFSSPQNVLEQPKKCMFHNGRSFHASLFSVNLILFLFVLRLWRSQWAFFGLSNRVILILLVLLLWGLCSFHAIEKGSTEGMCLPSISIMAMVV